MLGHVELSTTQIYTQVSIRKLKAVHTLTHPGAKLERATGAASAAAEATTANGGASTNGTVPAVDAGDVLEPVGNGNGQDAAMNEPVAPDVAADALFAALDAEAEEDATGGP